MRDFLRTTLARSLEGAGEMDRLAAAWTVACGRAMAGRGEVLGYKDGVVQVQVTDPVWLGQMNALRGKLEHDLARIAGVRVTAIEFGSKAGARKGAWQRTAK